MNLANRKPTRRHKIHFNGFDVTVFIILSLNSIG